MRLALPDMRYFMDKHFIPEGAILTEVFRLVPLSKKINIALVRIRHAGRRRRARAGRIVRIPKMLEDD